MRSRLPWWFVPALVGLMLRVAAALSLRPWHDEYFTVWVSQRSWRDLLTALRWDSGPPLLYVLVKVCSWFGVHPLAAARGLSVLAGAAGTVLVGVTSARFASATAARWACWLYAVHPLSVLWSSEGRSYALLSLGVAGSLWALGERQQDRGNWVWLSVFLGLGLYSHALALLWLLTLLAYGLGFGKRRVVWAVGVAAVSFLPWLGVMLHQPPEAVAWMGGPEYHLPGWMRWLGPLRLLPPVAGWHLTLEAPVVGWWWQVGAGVLTFLALVFARGWYWLFWAFPAAMLALGSWVGVPLYYPGRGEALVLAPFLVFLANGVRKRWLGVALVALGAGGSGAVVHHLKTTAPRPEKLMSEALLSQGSRGVAVTTGWWWLGVRYHLPPTWEVIHLPQAALRHPGWFVPGKEKVAPGEVAAAWERLLAAQKEGRGVGVVITPGLPEAAGVRQQAQRLGWRSQAFVGAELWTPGIGP